MFTRRAFLKSALVLPVIPSFLAEASYGQVGNNANSPWLEDIAHQLRAEFHVPAVWLAVQAGNQMESAVVGVKSIDTGTPATLQDKLTVASVSKPMAGLWIASLVQDEKIFYDDKVLDILPELSDSCLDEHRDITLGQLLTHTAGVIRDVNNIPNNLSLKQYPAERLREARQVVSMPSPPGSKGRGTYSNNGVTLAVTMAERAAGEAYEQAAGRFYRERLGLKSWGVWAMTELDTAQPCPHSMNEGLPVARPMQSVAFQFVRPSGSAHCTIEDLARFGLMATDTSPLSETILSSQGWETVLGPVPNTGTTLLSFSANHERSAFEHSGSLGTTSSQLSVIPEWGVSIALHTYAGADQLRSRGLDLIQEAIRKKRVLQVPPPPCRLTLTGVDALDSTWQTPIIPKKTDDKLRIRVRFTVETREKTGDLQTLVRVGNIDRTDNRFRGLAPGHHTLHFEFDMPKTATTPVFVMLDALETGGNQTTERAMYNTVLNLR